MVLSPTAGTAKQGNSPEHPRSLGTVVGQVKDWVERCGWIWVEAQVIELRRRSAPTQFLTLRDTTANVSATITCSAAVLDAAGPLTEGTTVVARLTPRVWADRASLSFEAADIRIAGVGRLLAQIEALKRKLQAEGLFDPWKKKRLPVLPKGIGLITGADSAAERDVKSNVTRRWPAAVIVTRHALVQGPEAAAQVMTQLAELDADPNVDVIVIARGGGSLEDLLPFSDEGLVRAVAAAHTPVVSAIGHEPDTPILDLVADLRASTPTDAAKRIVPDAAEELRQLGQARTRAHTAIANRLATEQHSLDQLRSRPVLRDPLASFQAHAQVLANFRLRLTTAITARLSAETASLAQLRGVLRSASPQATLRRGYSILTDASGATLGSVAATKPGATVTALLSDGELGLTVTAVTPDSHDSERP